VLLAVGSLFAAGFAWLGRIAAVAEPDRLLCEVGNDAGHVEQPGGNDDDPPRVIPAPIVPGGQS
jgi:hypothetical protein